MCSSFYPSDSCVCLLRCPCLLVLCSDLLTQPLLTLFSLLTNPSPAELWAPLGAGHPSFWQACSGAGPADRRSTWLPRLALSSGHWARSEAGDSPMDHTSGPEEEAVMWIWAAGL